MSAAAQVAVDLSGPIEQSRGVATFRSIPRWPSASDDFRFDTSYLVHNALTALIPAIAGLLLTLVFLLHITIRYTCREKTTDARYARLARSPRAAVAQTVAGGALIFLVFTFISLGLLGNAALNFSAKDALDAINGLLTDLSRIGFATVDTAILVENRLTAFDPDRRAPAILASFVGDVLRPTLASMRAYALDAYPDVGPLRDSLTALVDSINDVLHVVRTAVNIVFGVTLAIILLLLSAPILLFWSDASLYNKRSRCLRILAQLLYLLVPALLAWILVGVASAVGAILADVCVSVHEYRDVLLGTGTASAGNPLVTSGFTCPEGISAVDLKRQIEDTAAGVVQSELASSTIRLLLNTTAQRVADAADWSGNEAVRLLNCSTQIDFSGKLEFIVCGRNNQSAIDGVFDLFVAFLGLALCLHLALLISLFGVQIARSLFVWQSIAKPVVSLEDVTPGSRFDLSKDGEFEYE